MAPRQRPGGEPPNPDPLGDIANNLIDGGATRLIEAGIMVGSSGERNALVSNHVINCSVKGFANAGSYTHFEANTAYNNGADAGVETG